MENKYKTTVIAEMAWAHDGSPGKAIAIMKAARDSGADAIGIHITCMEDYMVPYYGSGEGRVSAGKEHLAVYKYLDDINPSVDDWTSFAKEARSVGIKLCVMANDHASLKFCEASIQPDYYVLSAAAFVEVAFIDAVAATGRATLFRIGGATLGEVEATINRFRSRSQAEVALLHGFQNYPTKLEDTNVAQLATLKQLFSLPVGLADHIDGGDTVAKTVPILALALGATYLEKHITFNRDEKGEDFEAALNPADFREFVNNVRAAEVALGQPAWGALSPATLRYRGVSRKRTVAARDLPAGTVLAAGDFNFKRADVGIGPDQAAILIGRTLKNALVTNDGITLEDLL
jgi:N,N'-diacetyllegionaminate synthase